MSLNLVGLNHKTAPIEIRELVAVSEKEISSSLKVLRTDYGFDEAMILSTCNRVEVIARHHQSDRAEKLIKRFLHSRNALSAHSLDEHLYTFRDEKLVRHVFRVASSLDSMIQGEPQILGQVKQAYRFSEEAGVSGEHLSHLMPRAFFVAKRVRTETRIANSAVSVSSAAVELARKIFVELADQKILLLGAGKMGELVVKNLLSSGISQISVANRTEGRSQEIVSRLGGTPVSFNEINTHLVEADIVVVSTGSASHVLDFPMMEEVMNRRRYTPLFIIDISVPRNVAPEVNEIDHVFLFDIDDLESVITSNIEDREREAEMAENIVTEEVKNYMAHSASRDLGPFIRSFRNRIEEICLDELRNNRNGLSAEEYSESEKLVRRIARRISHPLTVQIKRQEIDPSRRNQRIEMIRSAFEIDDRE
jgi:glutamyl-tRNA reductase